MNTQNVPPDAPTRESGYPKPEDGRVDPDTGKTKHPEYAFLPDVKIPLVAPIKISGVPVTEITIRRPKVKDTSFVARMKVNDEERGRAFLRHLTGLSPDEFEELDTADLTLLGEWLELFTSARKDR